ncbi:MAG: metal-dependent hydrolase [Planctomycetes bacterium]|nr:metal-dependent hydrolase [Planctomycetota bacterium]
MVLGHITCTYIAYRVLYSRGVRLVLPAFLIGAVLPDVIDKPLLLLFGLEPHGVGHSILVILPVFGLCFLFFRNRYLVLTSLQLGILMHLVEDSYSYEQLFWPFTVEHDDSIVIGWGDSLYSYYVEWFAPITVFLEVSCTLLSIGIILYDRLWTYEPVAGTDVDV